MTAYKVDKLLYRVGVDGIGCDVAGADSTGNGIAFLFCTRGQHDFSENMRILGALVGHDGADTTAADNHDF